MLRHLYDLQELDLELSQCRDRITAIDSQLGDREGLDSLQCDLESHQASLKQLHLHQRSQSLDAESLREKVNGVEGKLYGGSISNLRELEGYQQEADILRRQLGELDDKVLEAMVALEEAQVKLKSLSEERSRAEEEWQASQVNMAKERQGHHETIEALEERRQKIASNVGQGELKLYEDIRRSRGGVAVAKVERGMCRGCSMALPTHQLQRARQGREPVQCVSCGRILFVS